MPRIPHILHIEDDEDDRLLFARAFSRSGLPGVLHSLAGAADGLLYLNQLGTYANAQRPRLIILDLSLPRLDGHQFLDILKTKPRFRHIPVFILTASLDPADQTRCRERNVEGFMAKPRTQAEMDDLIAKLSHMLTGSSNSLPITL